MRTWIKILFPIVGVAYCIAFLEINLSGGVHQTWNDEYDTYIVPQNNVDAHSGNQATGLTFTSTAFLNFTGIDPVIFIVFLFLLIPFFVLLDNSSGLYLKNCTFLI